MSSGGKCSHRFGAPYEAGTLQQTVPRDRCTTCSRKASADHRHGAGARSKQEQKQQADLRRGDAIALVSSVRCHVGQAARDRGDAAQRLDDLADAEVTGCGVRRGRLRNASVRRARSATQRRRSRTSSIVTIRGGRKELLDRIAPVSADSLEGRQSKLGGDLQVIIPFTHVNSIPRLGAAQRIRVRTGCLPLSLRAVTTRRTASWHFSSETPLGLGSRHESSPDSTLSGSTTLLGGFVFARKIHVSPSGLGSGGREVLMGRYLHRARRMQCRQRMIIIDRRGGSRFLRYAGRRWSGG
jgi:hypothetical protein